MRAALPYLQHILDAIAAIESYTADGRAVFLRERKTQDAVIRNLEIIGEAIRNVPLGFQSEHPEIPWREAWALREVVIRQYFGIDLKVVWASVEKDLPPLKANVLRAVGQI